MNGQILVFSIIMIIPWCGGNIIVIRENYKMSTNIKLRNVKHEVSVYLPQSDSGTAGCEAALLLEDELGLERDERRRGGRSEVRRGVSASHEECYIWLCWTFVL